MNNSVQGPDIRVVMGDSRFMREVAANSIDLVVTSPPYWNIKDYGVEGQVGYGQTLHEYLKDLYRVWDECHRVIRPGRRLCVNIGDQFARQAIFGRYKIIPLHSEVISQCERIGFDYLGSIIWQKKTKMESSGGAVVMGSYPYPPNGIVELDYEFILLFKKPGAPSKVSAMVKEQSSLTKEEWKEYFSGHWYFGGARQQEHEAMFPDELPKRLIRMFTFSGEMVLDPFLGSGTTLRAARNLGRRAVGYEINPDFIPVIREKMGVDGTLSLDESVEFCSQQMDRLEIAPVPYEPSIQDANPVVTPTEYAEGRETLHKVVDVVDSEAIRLHSGQIIRFRGVRVDRKAEVSEYLKELVVGKKVYVRTENDCPPDSPIIEAYVYLKNKIFVNLYLIKSGMGSVDSSHHKHSEKFVTEQGRRASDG